MAKAELVMNVGLLNDKQIMDCISKYDMISPFVPEKVTKIDGNPQVSFGLSSAGYDVRLGKNFIRIQPEPTQIYDVKNPQSISHQKIKGVSTIVLNVGETLLAETLEHFKMPKDVMGICLGKSTYARAGLDVLVTPLEPGWSGILTLELANNGKAPILLYLEEGICQIIFFRIESPRNDYGTGKYQDQSGVTIPKV